MRMEFVQEKNAIHVNARSLFFCDGQADVKEAYDLHTRNYTNHQSILLLWYSSEPEMCRFISRVSFPPI